MKTTRRKLVASTIGFVLGVAMALVVLEAITGKVFWLIAIVAALALAVIWMIDHKTKETK